MDREDTMKKQDTFVVTIAVILCTAVVLALLGAAMVLMPRISGFFGRNNTSIMFPEILLNEPFPASVAPERDLLKDEKLSRYDFDLTLDPQRSVMEGTLQLYYVNDEGVPMDSIHLLLYANSFEKAEYGAFEEMDFYRAYPQGFSPGSIEIHSLFSPEQHIEYQIGGEQNHVMEITLQHSIQPGESLYMVIDYTVQIPQCYGRFGRGENTWSLMNCNPILAVYEEGEWLDYPYYAIGDPFFSDVAHYSATVRTPQDYILAATGKTSMRAENGYNTWEVQAPSRRDFGFCTSNRFDTMQAYGTGGVLVRSYYLQGYADSGRTALVSALEALQYFTDAFGEYPYEEYALVQCEFFIGGMEYPGLVLIDSSSYGIPDRTQLDLLVAHESAHQWWYGVIGNDQVRYPWLDEGLTELSTNLFLRERRPSSNAYQVLYENYMRTIRMQGSTQGSFTAQMATYQYSDNTLYSAWVYDRAAQVLQDVMDEMGRERFLKGLQAYYKNHSMGIATPEDFLYYIAPKYPGDLHATLIEGFAKVRK